MIALQSSAPPADASGTIIVDQMYVQYQVPLDAKPLSLVLIHGCCLSGATWGTSPHGRMGWAQYFVRGGYPTYVVDQAGRGRSGARIDAINAFRLSLKPRSDLPKVFAASHEQAWVLFRFGPRFAGMKFPIGAVQLARTVLVSHSKFGIYPFQTAKLSTKGIAAIVAIEPDARGDLRPYLHIPVLIVWGDFIQASPIWAPRLKACQSFAAAANKEGGKVDLIQLPLVGIHGNTHMMMQDTNNIEVANWILRWIGTHADK